MNETTRQLHDMLAGRAAGCTCPRGTAEQLGRHLSVVHDPCPVHQAAEVERLALEATRDAHRERVRVMREAMDASAPPGPACTCRTTKQTVHDAIAEVVPTPCAVHAIPEALTVGVGDNPRLLRALSEFLGGNVTNHGGFSDDAA